MRSRRVSPRTLVAVLAGKVVATTTRSLGRGGGTALPGLVATRVQPRLVEELASQLSGGTTIVSGTNGKTTTSRMLATILAGTVLSVTFGIFAAVGRLPDLHQRWMLLCYGYLMTARVAIERRRQARILEARA